MPVPSSSIPRIWPSFWANVLRDRLQFFRLLCLTFALLALVGVGTLGLIGLATWERRVATAAAALVLGGIWVNGYRKRGFRSTVLAVEAVMLLVVATGIQNLFAAFGMMYIGLQYRALFGSRRDATTMVFVYAVVLVLAYVLLPVELRPHPSVLVIRLAAGAFCGYLMHTLAEVLTRDQERKRALRESEQRFRAVAENLREALLITDVDDRIILANARVNEVLGYSATEVIGKSATELLLPESQRNAFMDRLRQRLSGDSELYEVELVRKDGSRIHAEVSASPYRDASGRVIGTLGAISDISDRKRLEERLRQGMRMEAVGQLAGGVAHDFNNLLTVIKCNTELLLSDLPPGGPIQEGIAEIARSADRGAKLTQQLLAFSRKQFLQPRLVVLAEIVAHAAPMLRRLVRGDVMLVMVRDRSTDQVLADPLQLEHVLVTLVHNANDAMPTGGGITIETRALELTDEHPAVATQEIPNGRYAMLLVSDTGTGMSNEVMARLFEPFFTTKGPGEGTGLGLASVYGVVRQSGGFVDVESVPKKGTTFRIYLPLAEEKVLPALPVSRLQQV